MQKTSKPTSEIPYKAELIRKSLHLLAMVIPLGMFYLGKRASLSILVPLCVISLIIEFTRVRYTFVAKYIDQFFGQMMRSEEQPAVGSPVAINGATWVLLTATLLIFIFPVKIAAASMVAFMISDAAAALVGRRFGRFHWGASPKTMEGSAAFLVVAFLCLLFFNLLSLPFTLLIAVAAMVLELLSIPFNDNLYVPLVIATLVFCILKYIVGEELVLFL